MVTPSEKQRVIIQTETTIRFRTQKIDLIRTLTKLPQPLAAIISEYSLTFAEALHSLSPRCDCPLISVTFSYRRSYYEPEESITVEDHWFVKHNSLNVNECVARYPEPKLVSMEVGISNNEALMITCFLANEGEEREKETLSSTEGTHRFDTSDFHIEWSDKTSELYNDYVIKKEVKETAFLSIPKLQRYQHCTLYAIELLDLGRNKLEVTYLS